MQKKNSAHISHLPALAFSVSTILFFIGCSDGDPEAIADQLSLPCDTLHVAFEIGEEIGDSTNMFWSIASVDIDDQGRIFVLDNIDASVRAYDLNGDFITLVTRWGSGPGELLRPNSLTIMPDNRILISERSVGGYVVFNDSLEFERNITITLNNSPYFVAPLTNRRVVACRYDDSIELDMAWHSVAIYQLDSAEYDILLFKDSISSGNDYWDDDAIGLYYTFSRLECYGDRNGNVYFATPDTLEYRILGWDSLGNQNLCIERDIAPVLKSQAEIEDEMIYLRSFYDIPGFDPRPYRHRYMVADVGIGPDGHLWARRGTRLDLFFDIYDLDGNLLRNAVYPLESFSWKTRITPFGVLAWELDPLDGYQKLYLIE